LLEHLWKIFELYLNRKDKFAKTSECLERRLKFLKEVKDINDNHNIDENEKRAIKNSLAQIVCGSRLVDYDLVYYYYRNKNFRNFEVIAPLVAYWDELIIKEFDENGILKKIRIDERKYVIEKRNMIGTFFFFFVINIVFLLFYQRILNVFVTVFHMDSYIALYVCGILFLLITFLVLFALYGVLTLYDLSRLVK
jgi:hypothetical protein